MKRTLFWLVAVFIAGVSLAGYFDTVLLAWLGVIAFIALCIKAFIAKGTTDIIGFAFVLCFIFGAFLMQNAEYKNNSIIDRFGSGEVYISGYVDSEPELKRNSLVFILKAEQIMRSGQIHNINRRLEVICTAKAKPNNLGFGDSVIINGLIQEPNAAMNEGGFDYRLYLATRDIPAVVKTRLDDIKVQQANKRITDIFYNYRISLLKSVDKLIGGEEGAFVKGVILGETDDFSDDLKAASTITGVSHITAVSGMQLSVLIMLIMYLLIKAGAGHYKRAIICIITVIPFMVIMGFTPSVARAGYMAIMFFLASLINRRADAITSLAASAGVLVLYNPYTVYDLGFLLSFAATLGILLYYQPIVSRLTLLPVFLRELIAVTLSAQVLVIILIIWHFNSLSIIGVFANLLIVPLSDVIFVGGFVMAALGTIHPWLGLILALPLKYVAFVTVKTIYALSAVPYAAIALPQPHILMVIAYFILAFVLYRLLMGKYKLLSISMAVIICTCLLSYSVIDSAINQKTMTVEFINVGEADCALVHMPDGKSMIIDGANGSESNNNAQRVVIPFLKKRGINKLDAVILTHFHADHAGGILTILNQYNVGHLYMPSTQGEDELKKSMVSAARERNVEYSFLGSGDNITFNNGVNIDILWPDKKYIDFSKSDENGLSLVFTLAYGGKRFLFTGDIQSKIEQRLIKNNANLSANFLKVAHHGSKTATDTEFITAVMPQLAVISVGQNSYGHPGDDVIDRLNRAFVDILRTDQSGNIRFKIKDTGKTEIEVYK